jgi:hypothetical protein
VIDWIFFGPSKLIALWPYAGVLLAVLLVGWECLRHFGQQRAASQTDASLQRPWLRRPGILAAALWTIYSLYEQQFRAVFGTNAVRLDLIVLVPLLYVLTLAAVIALVRRPTPSATSSDTTRQDAE